MPLPIISIPIDDAGFTRFKDLFDRYQTALAKTPAMWAAAGKEQKGMAEGFARIASSMLAVSQLNRETAVAAARGGVELARSEGLWTSIARSAGSVASSVFNIGAGLLKWVGIPGAIGGLLGAGAGLWGLDRLAGGVARDRRTSLGLGMSFGGYRAFGTDLGRFIDTGAYLGGINAMETNLGQQSPAFALLGHGLSGNTGADSVAILQAARNLALRTPTNQLGMMFGAYAPGMFSPEEQRRMQSASPAEWNKQMAQLGKDAAAMNVTDKAAEAWQNLITQLERAGKTIGAVLIEGLLPLEGPLEKLSKEFVEAVSNFVKSGEAKEAIQSFAHWLGDLGNKFGALSEDLGVLEGILHVITNPGESVAAGVSNWSDWREGNAKKFQGWVGSLVTGVKDRLSDASAAGDPKAYTARLEAEYGLKPGTLDLVKQLEASGLHDVSGRGAKGLWQTTAGWDATYGITDPTNIFDQERGVAKGLGHLKDKYGGNMGEILAAYISGEGNVDIALARAAKAGRHDWLSFLPISRANQKEVQAYVGRGLADGQSGVMVVIQNNTGGSAHATVSTLPTANNLK